MSFSERHKATLKMCEPFIDAVDKIFLTIEVFIGLGAVICALIQISAVFISSIFQSHTESTEQRETYRRDLAAQNAREVALGHFEDFDDEAPGHLHLLPLGWRGRGWRFSWVYFAF